MGHRHGRGLALALEVLLAGCQGKSDAPAPKEESAAQAPVQAAPQGAEAVVPLAIRTASGRDAHLSVESARTPAEQEKGLSGRASLPAGSGMLFTFLPPRMASFWMKDTTIPLDLLFVRTDGTIAAVLPGKPEDMTPISPGEPVIAVIEIGRGQAKALGIAPGDVARWGDCRPGTRPAPLAERFCPS